jgi:hypothetical protein
MRHPIGQERHRGEQESDCCDRCCQFGLVGCADPVRHKLKAVVCVNRLDNTHGTDEEEHNLGGLGQSFDKQLCYLLSREKQSESGSRERRQATCYQVLNAAV